MVVLGVEEEVVLVLLLEVVDHLVHLMQEQVGETQIVLNLVGLTLEVVVVDQVAEELMVVQVS